MPDKYSTTNPSSDMLHHIDKPPQESCMQCQFVSMHRLEHPDIVEHTNYRKIMESTDLDVKQLRHLLGIVIIYIFVESAKKDIIVNTWIMVNETG